MLSHLYCWILFLVKETILNSFKSEKNEEKADKKCFGSAKNWCPLIELIRSNLNVTQTNLLWLFLINNNQQFSTWHIKGINALLMRWCSMQ
jgi:hypothetical protein